VRQGRRGQSRRTRGGIGHTVKGEEEGEGRGAPVTLRVAVLLIFL
jgi:hypothetical protein